MEIPRNREWERNAYAPRLRTYTQPTQLFAAGAPHAAHTQPALRTGLMAPAWRLHNVARGVIPGLMAAAERSTHMAALIAAMAAHDE